MRYLLILSAAAISLCVTRAQAASDGEFSIGIGGAQARDLGAGEFDNKWGVWVQPRFSLAPSDDLPNLRLGAGLGFSYFSTTEDDFFGGSLDVRLYMFTPEVQVSWRQKIGERFYLEPGVALGVAIGAVDALGSDWGAGYSIRPFVRAGWDFERISIGAEAGYQFGHLEFDEGGGSFRTLNVGAFVAVKL